MRMHPRVEPAAWPLWPLPLACAGLLLLASHLSYLLAAATGHVDWCLPYGPDCTSISATGRQMPARLVFKPLLTMGATGLVLYWLLMARWLRLQGVTGLRPLTMGGLGVAGALCLIAYTAALGEGGDTALILRRLGAVLGFSLAFLAQLLLTDSLRQAPVQAPGRAWLVKMLWGLVMAMLMLGLASALLAPFPWHDRIDDGIEWILALMLNGHVALTALLWRGADYRLSATQSAQ